MVVFTGAPLGGFLGKIIVAQLLPTYGWPVIFWIGGLLPLGLIPVLLIWCPESPRVLLARGQLTDRAARVRNTGMGWALGIGRLGGIAGPWLGGVLLGMGLPPRQIFLATCLTAATATVTMLALGLRGRRQARAALQGV